MARNSSKYQCYATLCVNLLSITYGASCGWGSAAFLLFQSVDSPLDGGPLSATETSWIGSTLCIGGLFGNVLFGWMSDKFGRKLSMLIAVVPQLISWILLVIAKDIFYLVMARFIGGVAGGAVFILIPLYITEISEDRIRGSLGSCLVLSTNIGMLIAFVLGDCVPYNVSPYVFIAITLIFLVLFVFLPESPIYLMKIQKEEEAEKSLRYYRNLRKISSPPECFKAEVEKLKCEYIEDKKKSDEPVSWSDFNNPLARRVILVGLVLMALNQFCGCFAMITYTANIFAESGSSLSPNSSAIIVGIIQLLGAYVSTLLVERAGRKILLTVSAIGTGCGHICLGTYTYLKMLGYSVDSLNWIPIVSFSFVIFIASCGILTLPFLVLSEISPLKIRSVVVSFCMTILWFFAFIMLKYLPIMTGILQLHGCLFIFAAVCFAGAIFIFIVVPETKGKSIETILAAFEEKMQRR